MNSEFANDEQTSAGIGLQAPALAIRAGSDSDHKTWVASWRFCPN
jgi:hypothetical protein